MSDDINKKQKFRFSSEYIGLNNCKMHSPRSENCGNYTTTNRDNNVKYPMSKFAIFCEVSSVRGMQKIYKSKTKFLKYLWFGFVFFMTILLIVISTNIVIDFRNYHTAWHITTEHDEKTEFPAISICSHNPFSTEANNLWKEGKVLTPENFRKRLFEAEMETVRAGNYPGISLFDKADDYYGNVDYASSIKLSHKRKILQYCVVLSDGFTTIAEDCLVENETGFTVTQFSHYNYFNCFTIEAKSERNGFNKNQTSGTNDTVSIIILINVNLFSDLFQANESFVMDSLTRGEGLRIVIHEVGSYPDIDQNGINIQPGKMNEITFQNVHWTRYSSPKKECRDNQDPIVDLDRIYDYTFSQCLNAFANKELIDQCGCMSTIWPRPKAPTKEIPYCNDFSGNLTEITNRMNCALNNIYQKLKAIKTAAIGTKCWPICTFNTYETTLSVTRWKPSLHKLRQITKRYRNVNKYIEQIQKAQGQHSSFIDELKNNYIEALLKDLNFKSNFKQSKSENVFNENQMNYVHLVRKNFDTTKRFEKLLIDIYIFISRIGGLCSLCIGLTTAFFIEIIEFIYLCSFQENTTETQNNESNFCKRQQQQSPLFQSNCCETYFNKTNYWHDVDPICQCVPMNSSLFSPNINEST